MLVKGFWGLCAKHLKFSRMTLEERFSIAWLTIMRVFDGISTRTYGLRETMGMSSLNAGDDIHERDGERQTVLVAAVQLEYSYDIARGTNLNI